MKLTPGKLSGLKAVSSERGIIAAAAMDQRGSLKKALAKEKGGDITDRDMEEFKTAGRGGADAACQRHPARSRVGAARLQAPQSQCRPAAGVRKDRLRQDRTGPLARPAGPLVGASAEGSRRRRSQDPALLHAPRRQGNQRPEARLGGAHRRRMPRQRHSVLPRAGRLRRRGGRKGFRVRQEEAGSGPGLAWPSSPRTAMASTC